TCADGRWRSTSRSSGARSSWSSGGAMHTNVVLPRVDATPALRALCLAGAIGMAVQVLFLVVPPISQVILAHVWDKCVHFLYFGTMAAFLYMAAGGRRPLAVWLLVAAIGA